MSDQETRLTRLEDSMAEIKNAVMGINQSLQALTRLEERHAETRQSLERAFTAIEKTNKRVSAIEGELPTLKLARTAMFSTIGLIAVYVIGAMIVQVIR